MGRSTTGAVTTGAASKIELSKLLKSRLIVKGRAIFATMEWTNGSSIRIETNYNAESGNYIRLIYTNTDRQGNKTDHDYKIQLETVPSNLGKGELLYFVCPVTHRNCRILYCCYGSDIWKSRLAYRHRIYYSSQKSSKMEYWNDRYWYYESKIKQMESDRRNQVSYKGKTTKFALKMLKLKMLQNQADNRRWMSSSMPMSLRKIIFNG